MVETISADVEIRDAHNAPIVAKPMHSTYVESRQIATDGAFESVLNGALLEFIRNFARDPSILDALRGMQREKIAAVSAPLSTRGPHTENSEERRNIPDPSLEGNSRWGSALAQEVDASPALATCGQC